MSLFIIGSANRVTSNIVLQLARNSQYSSITIADLLPSYQHHYRFYRLQKQLANLQLNTKLNLTKIFHVDNLHTHRQYSDVLFVTHDYYEHVTSKTKLMELTAQVCQKRSNIFFSTPVEYDHYGFVNPQANYLQSQNKVRQIAPQATFIRSDVQDETQAMACINSNKNFITHQMLNFFGKRQFSPKIVSTNYYASVVCNTLRDKVCGKNIFVQGEQAKSSYEVPFAKDVEEVEYNHAINNIINMTTKYNGIIGEDCERVAQVGQ